MRAVVVTGCLGGVGQALCRCLSDAGYLVLGLDKRKSQSQQSYEFLQFDLGSKADSIDSLRRWIEQKLASNDAKLAALINNAAVQHLGSIEDLSEADFLETLEVNVLAPFRLVQSLFDKLTENRGSVVNIGSIHSVLTKPGFVGYATSKAALRGLTFALAQDAGSKVRVNIIEPAAVATPMLRAGFESQPENYARLEDYHPTGRIAEPEEVARLALFLISEDAAQINGAVFPVDGGISSSLHDPAV